MMESNSPKGAAPFDDIGLMDSSSLGAPGSSIEFQDLPHTNAALPDDGSSSSLLHPGLSSSDSLPLPSATPAQPPSNASFWHLAYYQRHFDVTTTQIRGRLLRALLPMAGSKFYNDDDPAPDLYGPFWVTTTLIFLLAAAGNFANYISFMADNAQSSFPDGSTTVNGTTTAATTSSTITTFVVWTYDIQKISVGASVFYAWISLVPLLVYCAFARLGSADAPQKGIVEIASIFGYGLTTLLPVCILCIPPVAMLRWLSVGLSFLWSSYFLIRNLGADVNNKAVFPFIAAIVVLNFGIAILTKFYFFDF